MIKRDLNEFYNLLEGKKTSKELKNSNQKEYSMHEMRNILKEGYKKSNNEEDKINLLLHKIYEHYKDGNDMPPNRQLDYLIVDSTKLINEFEKIKKFKEYFPPTKNKLNFLKKWNPWQYEKKLKELQRFDDFKIKYPKALNLSEERLQGYETALAKRVLAGIIGLSHRSPESLIKKDTEVKKLLDYIGEIEERNNKKYSGLEKSLNVTSMGAIVIGLFMGCNQITGNAILSVNPTFSSVGGITLFLLGILGVALTIKK
jgi:hypothetical protein